MPLSIIIIKLISKCFLVAFWVCGAVYFVRSFKRIMKGAVAEFKANSSKEKRTAIIGACCVFAMATIAMIAMLMAILVF